MAYLDGFNYVSGPVRYQWSDVSSTATFRAFNPVTLSDDRTLIEAASDTTAIYGISMNDAANSLPGVLSGKALVQIPEPETIYATKIQTGVATSVVSIGQSYGIEKSINHMRLDTDSQATPMLTLVGDELGNQINSADSSVFVRWLGDRLGVFSSAASIDIFAQD